MSWYLCPVRGISLPSQRNMRVALKSSLRRPTKAQPYSWSPDCTHLPLRIVYALQLLRLPGRQITTAYSTMMVSYHRVWTHEHCRLPPLLRTSGTGRVAARSMRECSFCFCFAESLAATQSLDPKPVCTSGQVSDVGVIASEILNFAPIATRLCARERVWLQLATVLQRS